MKKIFAYLLSLCTSIPFLTLAASATETVEETTPNEYLAHAEKMLSDPLNMLLIGVVLAGFVAFVILYAVKYRKMK